MKININSKNLKKLISALIIGVSLVTPSNICMSKDDTIVDQLGIEKRISLVEDPEYYDTIIETFNNFPEGLLELLVNENYRFTFIGKERYLEDNILSDYMPSFSGYAKGFCSMWIKHVYVESFPRSNKTMGQIKNSKYAKGYSNDEINRLFVATTLTHELCHAVDYSLNNISYQYEFQMIYKREKQNYKNTIHYKFINHNIEANISTPAEYFAESSTAYLFYPENLKENCPETYEFFYNLYTPYLKIEDKVENIDDEKEYVKTK